MPPSRSVAKHFHNEPTYLVSGALKSLTRLNPSIQIDERYKIIYIKPTSRAQVPIISGGGSGHEPAFASLVGRGFLSAAIAGSIFASPSSEQIQQCLFRHVDSSHGMMVIIMNYTGDVMHFGIAVEKARARGVKVEMLVVGDDVGVGRARSGRIGRRGIAGTILVQKIASAAAAAGASLEEISTVARQASSNLVSVGASLSHVQVPGRDPLPDSPEDITNIEIGMGIHNEEGSKRVQADLSELINAMLAQLLDMTDTNRAYVQIKPSDTIVLLINNLGGVSILELGCITEEVCSQLLSSYRLQPVRIYAGTFMSSLNGLGFSISILKVEDIILKSGVSMLELLDAPVEVTAWPCAIQPLTRPREERETSSISEAEIDEKSTIMPGMMKVNPEQTRKVLICGLERLIAAEPQITKYDTMVGDGDCGLCLKTGAEAILLELEKQHDWDSATHVVGRIAQTVESNMDGTSGAIYAIFLNAMANYLSSQSLLSEKFMTADSWAKALESALQALWQYTPAKAGDRTLVDCLQPFVETMVKTGDFPKAVTAAKEGCERTRGMQASLGRSVYVGGDDWKHCPDPGAFGLAELLLGMSSAI